MINVNNKNYLPYENLPDVNRFYMLHALVKFICKQRYLALFFSHLSNRLDQNKTKYTLIVCSHVQCIILLSLSCILYPFTYKTLWYKWQLTGWVGVNAAVHSAGIGKEENKVINVNILIPSTAYCFENDIYESTDVISEPTRCNQILIVTQAHVHLQLRTSTFPHESE